MRKFINSLKSTELYYYTFIILFLILSFNYLPFIFAFIFLIYYLRKIINIKIVLILSIIISTLFLLQNIRYQKQFDNKKILISEVKESDYNYQIKGKVNGRYYNFYWKERLEVGYYYHFSAKINLYDSDKIPNGFNAKKYYQSNNTYGYLDEVKIFSKTKRHYIYYLNQLKINLTKNLDNKTNNYLNKIVFNQTFGDEDIKETLMSLNIMHLISLSGLHIYLVIKLIRKLNFNLNIKTLNQEFIELSIVIIFYLLTSFKYVIFRILIYHILKIVKSKTKIKISNYSLLQLSFLILIIIKPYLMINTGVLISYLIVNVIMLLSPLYKNKSWLEQTLVISLIVAVILIPFNNRFNIISIILMPLFNIFFIYLLFPLGLLVLFFNNFSPLFLWFANFIVEIMEVINNNLNVLTISFGKMHVFTILIYYLVVTSLLYVKKNYKKIIAILIIIMLSFIPNIKRSFLNEQMYFLDVGQGDAFVYIDKNIVIVVDAYQYVGDFLKSKGIKQIDYLILSHSDSDHSLEAASLINDFNVVNIIVSKYDNNYNLNSNLIKAKAGFEIKEKLVKITFIGPLRNYNTTNDNSLVFKLATNNISILFTGDIMETAELDIAIKYQEKLKADILKVSHHGSDSSSMDLFINYVKPSAVIISVGKNNRFNFPSQIVIDRFNKLHYKIYRTDYDKTIIIYNNKIIKYNTLCMKIP